MLQVSCPSGELPSGLTMRASFPVWICRAPASSPGVSLCFRRAACRAGEVGPSLSFPDLSHAGGPPLLRRQDGTSAPPAPPGQRERPLEEQPRCGGITAAVTTSAFVVTALSPGLSALQPLRYKSEPLSFLFIWGWVLQCRILLTRYKAAAVENFWAGRADGGR